MPLSVIDSSGTAKLLPTPNADPIFHYGGTAFSAVATPTAIIVIKAHATLVRRVRRVRVSGAATAAGSMPITVVKRTTDGTVGSAALTDVVPARANPSGKEQGPSTVGAVSTVGTANYTTLGTIQGILGAGRLNFTALATGVGVSPFVVEPPAPVALLPGSTEEITVELNGAAIPSGGVVDWEVITEESAS